MKFLAFIIAVSLQSSCTFEKKDTPKPVPVPGGQMNKAAEAVELPFVSSFIGHYVDWMRTGPKSAGYGMVSIDAIDKKNKRVSFSTLFSGKRKTYTRPYTVGVENEEESAPLLEVKTKMFNFSSDGANLYVELFEGIEQSAVNMTKSPPFKYVIAHRATFDRPVVNKKNMEFPTWKFENASEKLLQVKDVENLRAVDFEVMRNSIYARHGAAFEDARMTEFFSVNDWYSPIFTFDEAAKKLTDIETKNINLIARYEKHAKHYYEEIGR